MLVNVASGACTTVLLPPQPADWDANLLGWSAGHAACLAVIHGGEPGVLSAYDLDGELVHRLELPDGAQIRSREPAGNAIALASCLTEAFWCWYFRSGVLQQFGAPHAQLADGS